MYSLLLYRAPREKHKGSNDMKIKNITTKTGAQLLAIVLATGVTAYEFVLTKQTDNIKVPFKQVLEEFQDDTLLDEAEKQNIAMYQGVKITEAADKVLTFIESQDSLDDKDKQWLQDNAKEITTQILLWSIKSTVADELDIPLKKIQEIGLPYTNEYNDLVLSMKYDNKEYTISKNHEYILNALYLYYQVNENDIKDDPDYTNCKVAINAAKVLIVTSVDENNYILDSKRSLKEAKKILKKD